MTRTCTVCGYPVHQVTDTLWAHTDNLLTRYGGVVQAANLAHPVKFAEEDQ